MKLHSPTQHTDIPQTMIEAYKATYYRLLIEDGFTLPLNAVCPQLAQLFATNKVESAAFITAYNPFSQTTTPLQNAAAQGSLEAEIKGLNLRIYPGQGEDPTGQWEPEVSALVMGIGLEQAKMLGIKYQQNAIVWIGADVKPQLLLLR